MAGLTLYYDGWCPLCRQIRRRLERLDWLGQLAFVSMREPGLAERLGRSPAALAARMHLRVERTGQLCEGIEAVAAVAARLPLLWPLWPLLFLATKLGFGQPLYDAIARRRTVLPVGGCEDGACQLHPPAGQPGQPG